MEVDFFNLEIFARTVWMEARGEGEEGWRDVAHSIWNRHQSKKWYGGATVAAVCLKDQQYSCWNASRSDDNREKMALLPMHDPVLSKIRSLCLAITDGEPDTTGGATHYHDARMPEWPSWATEERFVKQTGHHRFYKDVP